MLSGWEISKSAPKSASRFVTQSRVKCRPEGWVRANWHRLPIKIPPFRGGCVFLEREGEVPILSLCQVGMNGNTFSIKAPKECSKKFVATFKGNSLPEEKFLEYSFCS